MSKENGIGMTVTVDDSAGTGRAITNDVHAVEVALPSPVQDVTGIDSGGMERLFLIADLSITLDGVFNDAATTGAYTVLRNFRTLAAGQLGRTIALAVSGDTLSEDCLFTDFALTRAADGSLTFKAPALLSDGALTGWS